MKFYLCVALFLAIVAIGIGYEMKKIRTKRSASKRPTGFITIETDDKGSGGWGNSGWGSSGWGSNGWGDSGGGIQLSIKMNKKLDLGRMLSMISMGWDDDEDSGWGSSGSGWGSSGGGNSYGGSSGGSYGGGGSGWSYGQMMGGGNNGYDGNSGYRRGRARRSRS